MRALRSEAPSAPLLARGNLYVLNVTGSVSISLSAVFWRPTPEHLRRKFRPLLVAPTAVGTRYRFTKVCDEIARVHPGRRTADTCERRYSPHRPVAIQLFAPLARVETPESLIVGASRPAGVRSSTFHPTICRYE